MAEIIANGKANKNASQRKIKSFRKICAPKLDMTPMVDLGFLLISFFIFTAEISRPSAANLSMPRDGVKTDIPASKSLTFLLGANNRVFYYFGLMDRSLPGKLYETSYSELAGLGNVIRQKQAELNRRAIDQNALVIPIKPGVKATYKNVVDALDEMLINRVHHYVLCNPEPAEALFLAQ